MDDLPPLYARWMRSLVGGELPRETVATCATCVMVPTAGVAEPAATTFFDATTRCCTFLPELHNFLVGALLADPDADPVGRASVVQRLEAGTEVTPLGLGRSRAFLLLYDDGGQVTFGRSRAMRCPHHLDDGRCGVWRHRESTCATWFCKHVRGATGQQLWKAVQRTLTLAERDLAWWCVRELGLDLDAVERLFQRAQHPRGRAEVSHPAPDLWGAWAGREQAFYRACAERVAALSWADVEAIASPDLALAGAVVRERATAAAATELPPRLRVGPITVTGMADEQCTLTTHSSYDPLTIPLALLGVLEAFDGRPTAEVLDWLRTERDVELDHDLVHRLVDFGVLRP